MRWPPWKMRARRPERVAIRLRNGKTAWVYPGERIIDMTEKGMEPQFDIYVSGTYMGRASWATCKALRDSEAERPDRVHGVVLEDSDPPRLVLNSLHDESPALVRRVVEAMSTEAVNLKDAARTFEKAINSEPGVSVTVAPTGAHDIHAAITHTKWAVKVMRTKQEQVYP